MDLVGWLTKEEELSEEKFEEDLAVARKAKHNENFGRAVKYYRRALEFNSDNEEALLYCAIHLTKKSFRISLDEGFVSAKNEGKKFASRLLHLYPNNSAYLELVLTFLKGEEAEFVDYYLRKNPESSIARKKMEELLENEVETLTYRGGIKFASNLLQLEPNNSKYLEIVLSYVGGSELSYIESYLKKNPKSGIAWSKKATLLTEKSNDLKEEFKYEASERLNKEAEECYKKAISLSDSIPKKETTIKIPISKPKNTIKVEPKKDFDAQVEESKKIRGLDGNYYQSNGEKIIADFLHKNNLDFDYDKQITLKGNELNRNGYSKSWVRPDFYLTEFDFIIEYWGMKGTKEYDSKMEMKKRLYKESGTKFISFEPKNLDKIESLLSLKLKRLGISLVETQNNVKRSSKVIEKRFKCSKCSRPISHKGNCYSCNIKNKHNKSKRRSSKRKVRRK